MKIDLPKDYIEQRKEKKQLDKVALSTITLCNKPTPNLMV